MTNKNFNATAYWQERHQKTDLSTVGYIGLGLPFNYWMYRVREKVFNKIVLSEEVDLKKVKVLDIGSGSGFYIKGWQNLGVKNITASDFSPNALKQIKKTFRNAKTLELDITTPLPNNLGKFDIISAFDILYHIVDDKKYNQAIKNIRKLLKPNGIFIFSENLPLKTQRARHQVSRDQKTIFSLLDKFRFKIKKIRPVFFLMNAPLCSTNLLSRFHWFILVNSLIKLNFLGYILGPLLYPFELLLTLNSQTGPSTKIIVSKRY
ncbi:MAG: class I SAM-dependent methyltransferase [Patescibacteria group bacterium]|nr:class I SAM-dependent methyltransferase [Patescibacteria group bacterium]